jgi:hypothetical protein
VAKQRRRRGTRQQSDLASDLARAYEYLDWLKRGLRSRDPAVRERAQQLAAEFDRLDREIDATIRRMRSRRR